MSQDVAVFLIEKICGVLDSQKDSNFPCDKHFQALKTKLTNKKNRIGPDTDERDMVKLRDKLYDLDDLLLECLALSVSGKQSMMSMVNNCTPFKSIKLYDRFRTLKKEIEEILGIKGTDTIHPPNEVNPEETEEEEEEFYEHTTSYVDISRIFGWDEKADDIAAHISNNENFTATAIAGICGSGKTTLAQKVFVHDKMKDKFPVRLWVCIGPECTKENLLYRMLDNLGLDVEEVMRTIEDVEVVKQNNNDEEKNKSKIGVLLYILYLQLIPKGYLIVFDDVREDVDPEWYRNLTTEPPKNKEWCDRFAYGLPKIKDSAVIVTCRKEEFAQKMVHTGVIYRPDRLNEIEALLVFERSFEEAMNIALEKDMKKLENEDIKREIEDKISKVLEKIEAAFKDTYNEVFLNGELVEAEKQLEEARRDYEKEKSLEEIDKEISAKNEHLDKVKEEARKYHEKEKPLEGTDKENGANNEHLDKVKEEARKYHEKEKPLEGTDKENGANNEHLDSEKHESEDLQKVINAEIAKLKEEKKKITAKKWMFDRSKNKVEEIKKMINDRKNEKEKKEGLADKIQEVINKEMDLKVLIRDIDEEINEKQKILNKMIIIHLKLDKMKKQICGKCLGLPVALIEAAKGLAFNEYNTIYHS